MIQLCIIEKDLFSDIAYLLCISRGSISFLICYVVIVETKGRDMDKDTAIHRIIDIFVMDGDEWRMSTMTEQAAKDSAEALTLLTGRTWYHGKVSNDQFYICPTTD